MPDNNLGTNPKDKGCEQRYKPNPLHARHTCGFWRARFIETSEAFLDEMSVTPKIFILISKSTCPCFQSIQEQNSNQFWKH